MGNVTIFRFFENGFILPGIWLKHAGKEASIVNRTKIREIREPEKMIAVDIERLSAMLSCGYATARKIGEQAHAKIIIGRRVLYSVEKVRGYLNSLAE